MMKVETISGKDEHIVLTGMIVDSAVLGRISGRWRGSMFRSRWANIIAQWCLKYYQTYGRAPMRNIEPIFHEWSERIDDKQLVATVHNYINAVANSYKQLKRDSNSDYILDMAGKYFNRVGIERLMENLQDDMDTANVESAEERLQSFNRVELGLGESVDVLNDKDVLKKALEQRSDPLIVYPGDLGKFFGTALERDAFVAVEGPEKRGKSFWLLDMAYRAVRERRKVAFFEVGDMTQDQVVRRIASRISRRPINPGTVQYPVKIRTVKVPGRSRSVQVQSEEKQYKEKLTTDVAWKMVNKFTRQYVRSKQSYWKLWCYASGTLSVMGIEAIIQDWIRNDWVPDVIIIDYADNLDMTYPGLEGRECINETWKRLRGISQKYHCLVVTATQANAEAYKTTTMDMSNFSEDKRKLAHVTGLFGINQTAAEKEKSIARLNWIVLRESPFSSRHCVYVAECRALANVAVLSTF